MARSTRVIKIGTDCSGMEAPIQAMRNLPVKYDHKFSCDVDANARATIEANFPHGIMYEDLTKRDNKHAPSVDIYVAGFPCQPFSLVGLQQGFKDKRGRGKIFFKVLDYLRKQKPRVFILENVFGLKNIMKGKYLKAILKALASLKIYNVQWKILNTKDHGVPHSRRRWYCVGIQKKYDTGKFEFPEPISCPELEKFLDRRDARLAEVGLPPVSSGVARANVIHHKKQAQKDGYEPTKDLFVIECGSTLSRTQRVQGYSPCITCGRGDGHWLSNRGRRLRKTEMMRLQGMNPTTFTVAVTEAQLGKQLGNTMSVNVLERLLSRLLPAAKLSKAIKDRWESGQAVKVLSRTRGRGFKAIAKSLKKRRSPESSVDGAAPAAKRLRF